MQEAGEPHAEPGQEGGGEEEPLHHVHPPLVRLPSHCHHCHRRVAAGAGERHSHQHLSQVLHTGGGQIVSSKRGFLLQVCRLLFSNVSAKKSVM